MEALLGVLCLLRGEGAGTVVFLKVGGFLLQRFLAVLEYYGLALFVGIDAVGQNLDELVVFVDGVDVQVHGVATKMTYCFVRKSAEPEKLRALKYAYDDMKYRKAQYEAATTKYEKLLAATDTSKLPTDVEEFLRNVKL